MNNKGLVEPVQITTAQRNALIVGPADTGVIFNTSSTQYEGWNGTAWVPLNTPTTIARVTAQGTVPNAANGVVTFATLGITEPPGLDLFAAHILTETAAGSNIWRPQPYENTTANSCIWLVQRGIAIPRFEFFVIGTNVRNQTFRAILHYA